MQYLSGHSTFASMIATLMCLLLFLNLTTALPQSPPPPVPAIAKITTGANPAMQRGSFCFVGWDQRNYRGNAVAACCSGSCCSFQNSLLNTKLFSAKAYPSTSKRVRLWTTYACSGESRWVDSKGLSDLSIAPGYYFMSL